MTDADRDRARTESLLSHIRIALRRKRQADAAGRLSVARQLGQIGILGWIIVIPILLGILLGRWLDRLLETGVFWTGPLLLIGAVLGFWSAWRWMHAE